VHHAASEDSFAELFECHFGAQTYQTMELRDCFVFIDIVDQEGDDERDLLLGL
jgi:hypothetical protein